MEILNVGGFTNNYLLTLKSGYALVDTGRAGKSSILFGKLKRNHIDPKEIRYICLTHVHGDHAGFLNDVLCATDATVILHPKAAENLRRGRSNASGGCTNRISLLVFKSMKGDRGVHKFPAIEKQFEGRLTEVSDANRAELEKVLCARIIETPGHTDCSISLLLPDGDLICGDAAMNRFPSTMRATIWIDNLDEFCRAWEKIIALKVKALYPGHGKPFPAADLEKYLPKVRKINLLPLD